MGNNNLNSEIGNRIRLVREAQGRTREQIAELAEISSHFLFEIETGKKKHDRQDHHKSLEGSQRHDRLSSVGLCHANVEDRKQP